jgi:hypothetical protein
MKLTLASAMKIKTTAYTEFQKRMQITGRVCISIFMADASANMLACCALVGKEIK